MKKTLFILTSLCLSAFAKCNHCDVPISTTAQDLTIVNILDLSGNDINEITQGSHPNTAIEFSAKTTLPISSFLKGNLINQTKDSYGEISVQKTFYARFSKNGLILSSDLVEWKPFLEFITGDISIALKVKDNTPSFVFGANVNKRK